jgi:hypothetical protein
MERAVSSETLLTGLYGVKIQRSTISKEKYFQIFDIFTPPSSWYIAPRDNKDWDEPAASVFREQP